MGCPGGGVRVEGRWTCPEMGEGPGNHQAHGGHQSSVRLRPHPCYISFGTLSWSRQAGGGHQSSSAHHPTIHVASPLGPGSRIMEPPGSRRSSIVSSSSPRAALHLWDAVSWSHGARGGHQSSAHHPTIHVASPLGPGSRYHGAAGLMEDISHRLTFTPIRVTSLGPGSQVLEPLGLLGDIQHQLIIPSIHVASPPAKPVHPQQPRGTGRQGNQRRPSGASAGSIPPTQPQPSPMVLTHHHLLHRDEAAPSSSSSPSPNPITCPWRPPGRGYACAGRGRTCC